MSDDFSKDLSEVIGGHDQLMNNIQAFTQTPTMPGQYAATPPYVSPVVAPPQPMPPPPLPPTVQPQATMPQMFGQGQAAATQNYVSPMAAGMYGGGMYGGGMAGAGHVPMNYPSMSMMTPHQYGVFRQEAVSDPRIGAAMSGIASPQAAPTPMLPVPLPYGATSSLGFDSFERMRGDLQFRRGFDGRLDLGSEYARVTQGRYDEFSQMAGKSAVRMIAGSTFGVAGTALGAVGGYYLGGAGGAAAGARWGGNIGTVAGMVAADIPGAADVASAMFKPAIQRRIDALQTQFGSRSYLTGGRDLDYSGQGLSTVASQRLTTDFDSIARGAGMTRRDVSNITQAGGEQGLLDFAQNGQQLAQSVKGLVGLLATMGEITGDPNFQTNLKKMGQLHRLGFSTGEMGTAMRNMDAYARMAGLDVDQAMQRGGMQGAAVFQGAGLDAASGMTTGMFTQGAAKLGVQAGAFDARTLALYGGKSGVTQLLTEANAAFAAGPMKDALLPYLMRKGSDGKLGVDADALRRLQSGEVSFEDAIRAGSTKFQGDKDGLMQLTNNSKELASLVTRQAGPEGIQQMLMIQGANLADKLGTDLTSGYRSMGLTEDQSRVMARMAESPEFFENLKRQQIAERRRLRFEAEKARGGRGISYSNMEAFGDALDFGSPLDNIQKRMSRAMAEQEEDARLGAVGARKLRGNYAVYDSTYKYTGDMALDREGRFDGELLYKGQRLRDTGGIGEAYDRGSRKLSYITGTDAMSGLASVADGVGALRNTYEFFEAEGRDAAAGRRGGDDTAHVQEFIRRQDYRRRQGLDTANLYAGARNLDSGNMSQSLRDVYGMATAGDGPQSKLAKRRTERQVSKAAAILAQRARKRDDRAVTRDDIKGSLREAGMPNEEIEKIMNAPGGAENLLNAARSLMDGKTREAFDEKTQAFTSGLAEVAADKHGRKYGATDTAGQMQTLASFGFKGGTYDKMSDEDRLTLKEFAGMSTDEVTGVMLATMLNQEDTFGQSDEQKRAEEILQENPELAEHVAKGQRMLEANPEMLKSMRNNLDKFATNDKGYGSVNAESLRQRAKGLNDTQSKLGIVGLLKSHSARAMMQGIELKDTASPEEAMRNISALTRSKQASLDPAVVAAAKSGDRERFLRAISAVDGVDTDGVIIGNEGAGSAETVAQDAKIDNTSKMMARFAKYANQNAAALDANTKELKRFNDRQDGIPVPVENGGY